MLWWHKKRIPEVDELPEPKDIPPQLATYLIVQRKVASSIVWDLKAAQHPRPDNKDIYDIRLYHWKAPHQKHVSVKNYHSLDKHPELILYEGWWDKKQHVKYLEEKKQLTRSF